MNRFWDVSDRLDAFASRVIRRIWKNLRSRIWILSWSLVLLGAFVLFAVWLGKLAEKATEATASSIDSLPSSFWLWALSAVVAIVAIIILVKSKSVREYGKKPFKSKWVLWPAAIVGVIVLVNSFEGWAKREFKDYLRDKDIGGLPILARGNPVSPEATLAIIAECESGGRQFDDEGNLIVHEKSGAVGKYQILSSWHEEDAKKLGLDIRTEEGNEAFAKMLFEKFGTAPWEASRGCWGSKISAPYAKTFSGTTIATGMMRFGRDWSEWMRVPPGQELFFQRTDDNIAFEIELQNGETFEFPRNFEGHERFPLIQRIRFRVTDEEAEELSVWLRFSPFQIT